MKEDALWYEAAFVTGITNALNVVADSLAPVSGVCLVEPVEEATAEGKLATTFADIRDFYERDDVPLPFRIMAHDPAYVADFWQAVRRAFSDNQLSRRFKESLAFAASLALRSSFGVAFHLAEMRRLGISERGVVEIMAVAQLFASYTKIADVLSLKPDMAEIAPVDWSPAPGGAPLPPKETDSM